MEDKSETETLRSIERAQKPSTRSTVKLRRSQSERLTPRWRIVDPSLTSFAADPPSNMERGATGQGTERRPHSGDWLLRDDPSDIMGMDKPDPPKRYSFHRDYTNIYPFTARDSGVPVPYSASVHQNVSDIDHDKSNLRASVNQPDIKYDSKMTGGVAKETGLYGNQSPSAHSSSANSQEKCNLQMDKPHTGGKYNTLPMKRPSTIGSLEHGTQYEDKKQLSPWTLMGADYTFLGEIKPSRSRPQSSSGVNGEDHRRPPSSVHRHQHRQTCPAFTYDLEKSEPAGTDDRKQPCGGGANGASEPHKEDRYYQFVRRVQQEAESSSRTVKRSQSLNVKPDSSADFYRPGYWVRTPEGKMVRTSVLQPCHARVLSDPTQEYPYSLPNKTGSGMPPRTAVQVVPRADVVGLDSANSELAPRVIGDHVDFLDSSHLAPTSSPQMSSSANGSPAQNSRTKHVGPSSHDSTGLDHETPELTAKEHQHADCVPTSKPPKEWLTIKGRKLTELFERAKRDHRPADKYPEGYGSLDRHKKKPTTRSVDASPDRNSSVDKSKCSAQHAQGSDQSPERLSWKDRTKSAVRALYGSQDKKSNVSPAGSNECSDHELKDSSSDSLDQADIDSSRRKKGEGKKSHRRALSMERGLQLSRMAGLKKSDTHSENDSSEKGGMIDRKVGKLQQNKDSQK